VATLLRGARLQMASPEEITQTAKSGGVFEHQSSVVNVAVFLGRGKGEGQAPWPAGRGETREDSRC